ncbi:MAG: apolipoprotein N-acyltransferase [Thermodesulfobacteriota bacterium]|nr:apolipoprotein N-acyltransferase [Thermodesulfobacteriota bacterium]
MLIIAFPRFNLEFVAWFALIPLFYAIHGKNIYQSFYLGTITGFVFFLGVINWVFIAVSRYGNLSYIFSIAVLILLVSYLSLFIGAFSFLVRFVQKRHGLKEFATAPFIWVSIEYLRSFFLTGFPWESLGYSQYLCLPLIQISDITGVYGISFLIVLVNALLFNYSYNLFLNKEKRQYKEIILTFFLLFITFFYGQWRLTDVHKKSNAFKTIKVALIQGNIDQSKKWDPTFQDETTGIYRELTVQASKSGPDLIVWPETATPFYFQSDSKYRKLIFDISKEADSYLLFGSPAYRFKNRDVRYFNSAFLISANGSLLGRYDKIHLVPLGEYVPLGRYLYFIKKITAGISDFSSGESTEPLASPLGKAGVFICYEAIFPDLVRKFVKKGACFLVNITNDAWFGKTFASYQHHSMVVFRAVENRVFLIRAANTGISSITDSTGKTRLATEIFTQGVLVDDIHLVKINTFYTDYGDIFAQICLVLMFIIIIKRGVKKC